MMTSLSLRDQILRISQDYLGPAAERFIDRQISTHLGKRPDKLTHDDLLKLADWLRLSFALLTNDEAMVDEYSQRLKLVATGRGQEAIGKQWTSR